MAIDQVLLDHAATGTSVLRFYTWAGDSISFGANEAALRTWNRALLEAEGVPLVRRPTGGRGVWHGADDLTYAITAPLANFGGLRPAYAAIHARLAKALETPIMPVSLAPSRSAPRLVPGACFEVAVGGEVLVGGRKAIGSAQFATSAAFLQHGAIAREDRLPALARFRLLSTTVTTDPPRAPLEGAVSLAERMADQWRITGTVEIPAALTAAVEQESVRYAMHFQDPGHTWRR